MMIRLMDGTSYSGVDKVEQLEGQYYIFFTDNKRPPLSVPLSSIVSIIA